MWNEREGALVAEEGTEFEKTLCGCLHTRPLACLPEPKGAMLGKLGHFLDKHEKVRKYLYRFVCVDLMRRLISMTFTLIRRMKIGIPSHSKQLVQFLAAKMVATVTSRTFLEDVLSTSQSLLKARC